MKPGVRMQPWVGLLVITLLIIALWPATPAPAQSQLQLPVFRLTKITTSNNTTQQLGGVLEGIGRAAPSGQDEFRGKNRFFRLNEQNRTVLTQYEASGGFFAYDIDGLGRETPAGAIDTEVAKRLACQFLVNNNFVSRDGTLAGNGQSNYPARLPSTPENCNATKDFGRTTLIRAAQATVNGASLGQVTETIVGVVVEVPFGFINNQQFIPIGGAGGHISLLFTTTDVGLAQSNSDSLDSTVPGLAAVAMPFFGRTLEFRGTVPVRSLNDVRSEVEALVRAGYPNATNINVPAPVLTYMVDDASFDQTFLEPEAMFDNVTVTLSTGEVIVLRSFATPLVDDSTSSFSPTVTITTPTNGSSFPPNGSIDLTGTIANGTAPYTYQWLLGDETPLSDPATLNAPGSVSRSTTLPAALRETTPDAVTIILRVIDDNGVQRESSISITPDYRFIYVPTILQSNSSTAATAALPAVELTQSSATHTFGVEGNWDYPPSGVGGADLPSVIPDVTGFRTGMLGYGYTQRFYWTNASAWERDWRDVSLGGIDSTSGVDRAAFVYYAGHGGAGGILMASNKDSTWFSGTNARYQNLRWVGFASCQTLRVQGYTPGNEPIRQWFNAFQGAHMLLGFNSNMADVAFGGNLVANMKMPSFLGIDFPWAQLTIAQAWVKTAFDMHAGKPAYIYARSSTVNPVNDKLPKPGSGMPPRPLPVVSYHWVWWEF
ncbi:MAG: hypothetical protein KatS3mg055_2253 [Chloroflexus sp.]|uniref:DUF6345 domain-containing protein n=1 Tax=Chloroflexus sp. TaxID=1904827 RepID=UPI0021DC05B5|nr:DUF6345 domain-containing protein [Chloroflexus sp.]GIV89735.1 MAG: hypothetical protein KatS3mg055_2253 [Chloroflexus sp.]